MVTYFCPKCWKIVSENVTVCPHCGWAIDKSSTYVEKLILALASPDGATARRAAHLLGRIGDPRAVPSLIERLENGDAYVAAEAVIALGRIGSTDAIRAVRDARKHRFIVVRRMADAILKKDLENSTKGSLDGSLGWERDGKPLGNARTGQCKR